MVATSKFLPLTNIKRINPNKSKSKICTPVVITASTPPAPGSASTASPGFCTVSAATSPVMLLYQLVAPPKKPSSFGCVIQPSTIFLIPSNTQTEPSHKRNGTSKKLGVLLEKCPPTKLLLFLIVKNSCLE